MLPCVQQSEQSGSGLESVGMGRTLQLDGLGGGGGGAEWGELS